MRKVVAFSFSSLDGVAEAPDSFVTGWDDVLDARGAALTATQDAVVLGRRSFDEWVEFWPGSEIEPFATFINGVEKYVATSTPLERERAGTTVVDGDRVEFVRDLKGRPGSDIGAHASISVIQTLLAGGVVDGLGLAIAPVIAGSGRRLLEELPTIRLESIRSVTSPSGHLVVDYRPVRWRDRHAGRRTATAGPRDPGATPTASRAARSQTETIGHDLAPGRPCRDR